MARMALEQEIERPPQAVFRNRLVETRIAEVCDLADGGHLTERQLELLAEGARLQRGDIHCTGKRRAPRGYVEREIGAPLAGRAGHQTPAVERDVRLLQARIRIRGDADNSKARVPQIFLVIPPR